MNINSLYEKPVLFALAAVVVISVGTLVTTFIPLFLPSTQPVSPLIKPYTAVETEGRDIYIREGCNNCHTQTVRPMRTEVAREPRQAGRIVELIDGSDRAARFLDNVANVLPTTGQAWPASAGVGLPWIGPADALVARFYEAHNTRGAARLYCARPVRRAVRCTLAEEELDELPFDEGGFLFEYRPFEIVTIKIELG